MAEKNQVPLPIVEIKEKQIEDENQNKQRAGLKDLFKSRILLIRSLIIFFNW